MITDIAAFVSDVVEAMQKHDVVFDSAYSSHYTEDEGQVILRLVTRGRKRFVAFFKVPTNQLGNLLNLMNDGPMDGNDA